MENMIPIYAEKGKPLCIGRRGEENARYVVFDLSHWRAVYGPGTAQLNVQRTGETASYPAALTVEGNRAIWVITLADTEIPGQHGKVELNYTAGDAHAKPEVWNTIVMEGVGDPSDTPPEAHRGWVDKVLKAGADAQEAAAQVKEDAERVETALGQASWIGFELDDNGILYAVISPGFTGAQFALTNDGYLEVIYGT